MTDIIPKPKPIIIRQRMDLPPQKSRLDINSHIPLTFLHNIRKLIIKRLPNYSRIPLCLIKITKPLKQPIFHITMINIPILKYHPPIFMQHPILIKIPSIRISIRKNHTHLIRPFMLLQIHKPHIIHLLPNFQTRNPVKITHRKPKIRIKNLKQIIQLRLHHKTRQLILPPLLHMRYLQKFITLQAIPRRHPQLFTTLINHPRPVNLIIIIKR